MKIPMSPPPLSEIINQVSQDRFPELLQHGRPIVAGKYLHWDNLRHRNPPDGLDAKEWWLAIKSSRLSVAEQLPLRDREGRLFSLVYVPPIRQSLHEIDHSFGVTGPTTRSSSDVQDMVDAHGHKYLLANSLMEEAIRSSQLEGASTTRVHAKDMIRERRKPRDKSERMILNNFTAMERVEDLSKESLSVDAILELHSILVDGTLEDQAKAGVFRDESDNVVVELLHSTETAHIPPPAGELPDRLTRLVDFANGATPKEWLHPVLRSIVLHFMIGYDHPFVDGNGRVARALFYWSMLRHGYPLAKFLSISRVLRNAPAKYARAYLYTETDGGDATYFVDHQLQVILESIEALASYVERKVSVTQQVEDHLKSSSVLNHRQIRLLSHALRHPGFDYTVNSHATSHRVVPNTARADLNDLANRRLLVKTKRGRKHVYIAPRELESKIRDLGD